MQKRPLGLGETYLKFCYDHGNGTTSVTAMIHVSGPVTAPLLKKGFDLLQKRHPLLRASLSADDANDYFEVDDVPSHLPLEIIPRQGPAHWKRVFDEHMNQTFVKKKGYLWRATCIQGRKEHEIVASFQHTIIDGLSLGYFFRDLIGFCSEISRGKVPRVKPLPLLPNVERLQKNKVSWADYLKAGEASGKKMGGIAGQLFSFEKYVPLDRRRTRAIYLEHDEKELNQLISRCRANGTSLTGLLSAGLLMAVNSVINKAGSGKLTQVSMTPVDMRKRCNMPAGQDNLGCFVCAVTTTHSFGTQTSLWPLARSVRREIGKAVEVQVDSPAEFDRNLDLQILGGIKQGPMKKKFHLGAGVTNYGAVDLPVACGPFTINNFYSGAARHGGDWLMLLHASTFGGRLLSCACYEDPLLSPATANVIMKEFASTLRKAMENS